MPTHIAENILIAFKFAVRPLIFLFMIPFVFITHLLILSLLKLQVSLTINISLYRILIVE